MNSVDVKLANFLKANHINQIILIVEYIFTFCYRAIFKFLFSLALVKYDMRI